MANSRGQKDNIFHYKLCCQMRSQNYLTISNASKNLSDLIANNLIVVCICFFLKCCC